MNKKTFLIAGSVICIILIYTTVVSTSAIRQTNRLAKQTNEISQTQEEFFSELQKIAQNIPTKDDAVQTPQDEDITKGWKIYKSEKYNFEVKYPSDLTVSTPYGSEQIRLSRGSKNCYDIVISTLSGDAFVGGKIISYSNLSIKDQLILDLDRRCPESNIESTIWKTIKINGIDGLQAVSSDDKCIKQYLPWTCVIKDNLRYCIKYIEGNISEYNQVISTFKF